MARHVAAPPPLPGPPSRRDPAPIRPRSRALRIARLWSPQHDGADAGPLEVRPAGRTLNGLFDALRALKHERLDGDGFVYVPAPVPLSEREIAHVASFVEAARLMPRVCIGYPHIPGFADGPLRCADIEAAGLRVALDGVEDACTFRDFAHYPVCAVRFGDALARDCVADPRAAATLEAMAGLARNLGMLTLATGVDAAARDTLAELGVAYVGVAAAAPLNAPRSGAAAPTTSRSRYRDALYEP